MSRSFGTDYTTEVALGNVTGATTWNKFGYNEALNNSTYEVIAAFGGAFNQRLASAETLDIVSSSANDTNSSGTGANQLVIFGVNGDWDQVTEVIALNGTSAVTTSNSFRGINRMTIFTSGSANSNVGLVTATATTSGNTMATMPASQGTTQQCIFYVPRNYQFLATWMYFNGLKISGGGNPAIDLRGYVYSDVVDSEFEVYRDQIDTSNEEHLQLMPFEPFLIGEQSVFWIEAITDSGSATTVRGRFSGKLIAS